jgi:hypothetical protein
MKAQPIIYFSDNQWIIYQLIEKAVLEVRRFSNDEKGRISFKQWLPESPLKSWYQPISIVVDSRQEEYHWEKVPHVSIRDRQELLQLRQRKWFSNTPYSFAHIQGKSQQLETARLEDQALCIGLLQPDPLQSFVQILLEHKIVIQGIYSLPLLAENLLKSLPTAKYTLLVMHTEPLNDSQPFGLRQVFFVDNKLVLSRWIGVSHTSTSMFSAFLIEEINKTRQYLLGINALFHEYYLNAFIFTEYQYIDEINEFAKQKSFVNITLKLYNAAHWTFQEGLHKSSSPAHLYCLILQRLKQSSPTNHYARSFERRYFKYFKLRQILYFITATFVSISTLFTGHIIWQMYKTSLQTTDLNMQFTQMEVAYRETKALQPEDIDVLALKDTIDGVDWLSKRQRFPLQSFNFISNYLIDFPQLFLEKISWSYKEEISQPIGGENPTSKIQQLLQAKRKEAGLNESKFLELIVLEGKISPFDGNPGKALETVRNFEQHLKKDKRIKEIKELVLPLNLSTINITKGNLTHSNTPAKEAPFSLEITLNM